MIEPGEGNPRVAGFLAALCPEFTTLYLNRQQPGCPCRFAECHRPLSRTATCALLDDMARALTRVRRWSQGKRREAEITDELVA